MYNVHVGPNIGGVLSMFKELIDIHYFIYLLQVCYSVIDNLLEGSPSELFGYLTESVDVLSCPENITLQVKYTFLSNNSRIQVQSVVNSW